MKKLLFTIGLAGIIALNTNAQTEQIPNGDFENWHTEGLGEDPDDWGSLTNQFSVMPILVTKTTDANSGTYALKLISDTGTVPPPIGTGNPGDTVYGVIILNLVDYSISNAKYPFTSRPDSLIGFVKGTVLGGAMYMSFELTDSGQVVGDGAYFFASTTTNYTRFSVPVSYYLSNTPDTLVFMIFCAHPGFTPPAVPGNEWFIDDLAFVYNSSEISETANKIEFNIYPNPVANELNIITSFSEKTVFEIYDVTGKQIESVEIEGKFSKVSTAGIPAGTYIYQIVNKNSTVINKGKFNIVR